MEIPDAMIETQQRQMVDDFAQRLQMQGMNLDMYCQYTGQTPASMVESRSRSWKTWQFPRQLIS